MPSIFDGLHIGYSGLNAAQTAVNTTSNNISNADTQGYTRQRVVQQSALPLFDASPGALGNGTQVKEIVRVHDAFVFSRLRSSSEKLENSDFTRETLEELSTYFPEIENSGIKFDMQQYFDLWSSLAANPDNNAIKVALSTQTQTMSQHITQTRDQVANLQQSVNDQIKSSVDEINKIGAQIADLNRAISEVESTDFNHANSLRDQRGVLEVSLAKLIDATVFEGNVSSRSDIDRNLNETQGDYNVNIAGYNIIDGATFHPLTLESSTNANGFYDIKYVRQDGVEEIINEKLTGGKVGAILDLRGHNLDSNGVPQDGTLQHVINQLDSFASTMIESTNNLYAQAATTKMDSNITTLTATQPIATSDYTINTGSFDLIVYDIDGNEVARRAISIDSATTLDAPAVAPDLFNPNSIVGQINAPLDDNGDGNINNDVNSFVQANYVNGQFSLSGLQNSSGYSFAVEDTLSSDAFNSGTNFAGAIGLSRYFDGDDASDIRLNSELARDPSQIAGFKAPNQGNNDLANDIVQQQFESFDFTIDGNTSSNTLYGYYDEVVTNVGSTTNASVIENDAITAQYNAIDLEYSSISKVSIDEELTNLIKYQTAYGAASKIITTVDQMLNTLLGLKQ